MEASLLSLDLPWFFGRMLDLEQWLSLVVALFGLSFLAPPLLLRLSKLRPILRQEPEASQESEDLQDSLRQTEKQLQRLRSVLELMADLSSTLDYERVLHLVLDVGEAAVGTSADIRGHLTGAVLLFEGDELQVASARRLPRMDVRAKFPGKAGVIGEALNAIQVVACDDLSRDPELHVLVGLRKCGSVICIPLAVGPDVYGVIVYGHDAPDFFSEERVRLLEAVAKQAMMALQNACLYRDLAQEKERLTTIQEEARKKLARNLHDGPAQSVGAITMRVNYARRLVDHDQKAAAEELFKVEALARRTSKQIRQMLFTLRPLILETKGLVPALRHLTKHASENYDQEISLQVDSEEVDYLDAGKQTVLFYVAEEAITNACKHASAPRIWVSMKRHRDFCVLEIGDDGVGFNLGSLDSGYEQRGSLGMVNLRERAEIVGGFLAIESELGKGTLVRLVVPLTEKAAKRLQNARARR